MAFPDTLKFPSRDLVNIDGDNPGAPYTIIGQHLIIKDDFSEACPIFAIYQRNGSWTFCRPVFQYLKPEDSQMAQLHIKHEPESSTYEFAAEDIPNTDALCWVKIEPLNGVELSGADTYVFKFQPIDFQVETWYHLGWKTIRPIQYWLKIFLWPKYLDNFFDILWAKHSIKMEYTARGLNTDEMMRHTVTCHVDKWEPVIHDEQEAVEIYWWIENFEEHPTESTHPDRIARPVLTH